MFRRIAVSAVVSLFVAGVAVASAPDVTVELDGPTEGQVDEHLTYTAIGDYTLDEETEEEEDNGEASVSDEYTWSYEPASCVSPEADDASETFEYSSPGTYTITVTYTVTVTYNDGSNSAGSASDSISVQIEDVYSVQLTTNKNSICAGAKDTEVHQALLTATVTDSQGGRVPGVSVSFEITSQNWMAAEATLNPKSDSTSPDGEAQTTLSSSDKVCTITVKATIEDDSDTVIVYCQLPGHDASPMNESVIAVGDGSADLFETLHFGGAPVPEHRITWNFSGARDEDGYPTDPFGTLNPSLSDTGWNGQAGTTYEASYPAIYPGWVTVQAVDESCYDVYGNPHTLFTFSVKIVRLNYLRIEAAYQVGATAEWAAGISPGHYVSITAVLKPHAWSIPVGLITWSGQSEATGDPLVRRVPRDTIGNYLITASVGTSSISATIKVCELSGIAVDSGAITLNDDDAITAADEDDTSGVILVADLNPSVNPVPQGLLLWCGGSEVADHPEKRKVDKTYPRKTHVTCQCGASSDDITVWAVEIDLNIAGVADSEEDATPAEVIINSDDDNANGTDDRDDSTVSGENDLIEVTLELDPSGLPAGDVSVSSTGGIGLWQSGTKGSGPSDPWTLPDDQAPATLYVEGRSVSDDPGDCSITLHYGYGGISLSDQVLVTVLPREGDSEAYLRIFSDSALEEEASSPASEVVYPVLYVKVGPGERSATSSLDVIVRDEYEKYFAGTDVDGDVSVDLSSASGWQQEQTDGTWDNAATGPASTDNKDGADDLLFRYKMTWDTRTFPLGNNSPHSLLPSLPVSFEEWVVGDGWTNAYESGPLARSISTENLSISDCTASNGTIDYFKWDPDGDVDLSDPHITFTIDDPSPGSGENQHEYAVTVRYRQTMGDGTWNWDTGGWSWYKRDLETSQTVDLDLTNAEHSVDGNHLNGDEHEWGTYTYDFIVMEFEDGVPDDDEQWTQANADDWCFLKRYKDGYHLWVPENLPSPYSDHPGHEMTIPGPESPVYGRYCLASDYTNDQVDRGSGAQMTVIDGKLSEMASRSGLPTSVGQTGAEYGTKDADQDGTLDDLGLNLFDGNVSGGIDHCRMLVLASDVAGHMSPHRRDHQAVRMLTANTYQGAYPFMAYSFSDPEASKGAIEWAFEWMDWGNLESLDHNKSKDGKAVWDWWAGTPLDDRETPRHDVTASMFMLDLPNVYMCAYYGHGASAPNAGKTLMFGDDTAVGAAPGSLSDDFTASYNTSYLSSLSRSGSTGLAVLEACESGKDNPKLGTMNAADLSSEFQRLGFHMRIAFDRIVYVGMAKQWNLYFWPYAQRGIDQSRSREEYLWDFDWKDYPLPMYDHLGFRQAAAKAETHMYEHFADAPHLIDGIVWSNCELYPYEETPFVTYNGDDVNQ